MVIEIHRKALAIPNSIKAFYIGREIHIESKKPLVRKRSLWILRH
jgi:hypothetical protein